MASVVGQASAAATSVAIPAHQPGDLILVSTRGTVVPTVPTASGTVPAWTILQASAQFTTAISVAFFIATGSTTTTGSWTNALHIAVLVLRPTAGSTLSTSSARSSVGGANNATTIIYPALTLAKTDGTSIGVRVGQRVTAATQLASPPTNWVNQTQQPATTPALVVHTRAALAANPVADTVTAGASNAAYRAVTVEVQETPAAVTYYGVVALPISFNRDIKGQRKALGNLSLPITLSQGVQGRRKTFSQIQSPFMFNTIVVGNKTTFGQISFPINSAISISGIRITNTLYGSIALPLIFGKEIQAQRKTFGNLLLPFIFGKDVRGQRKTFGQIGFPINVALDVTGIRVGLTRYGVIELPVTFNKDIQGQRKTFGQTAMPIMFVKDIKAQRKTFGKIDFPIIFTKEAVGRKQVFGQLSMQTLFSKETSGQRKTYGQIALPFIFAKDVKAYRRTFGKVALPIGVTIFINGQSFVGSKTYYGNVDMSLVFSKQVSAKRKTFGRIAAPFIYGSASQGQRRTFSRFDLPLDFNMLVKSGPVGIHGHIALELILMMDTNGTVRPVGVILNNALDIYLGEQDVSAVYVGNEQVWP